LRLEEVPLKSSELMPHGVSLGCTEFQVIKEAVRADEAVTVRCGAATVNSAGDTLYFFVAVGAAKVWSTEGTRLLGLGSVVAIPPLRRTSGPGAYWLVCPGDDGWFTDPAALEAALADSAVLHEPE